MNESAMKRDLGTPTTTYKTTPTYPAPQPHPQQFPRGNLHALNIMATKLDGLPEQILEIVAERSLLDSYQYACELGKNHQEIVGAVKSLESLGDVSLCSDNNIH